MALYTPAQWAKIQANMPPEDRVSYAEYVNQAGGTLEQLKTAESATATTGPTAISAVESAAAARAKKAAARAALEAKAAASPASDAALKAATDAVAADKAANTYYTKIVADGLTQSQLDVIANATATANLLNQTYGGATPVSTVDPKTGKIATDITAVGVNAAKGEAALKAERDAAALKAKQEADAKAAADKAAADAKAAAELKAKQEAEAKAAADKIAADKAAEAARIAALNKAAADAKAAQVAAEEALAKAKTAAEVQAAKNAAMVADAKAALAAKQLELEQKKAEENAKAAQAAADAKLKQALLDAKTASDKAAAEAAVKAAQDAKAAADAAAAAAARDAALAASATNAANATANINVTGNTMLPLPGETPADTYARIAAEQLKMETRQSTIQTLTDRFNKYNLNGLAATIKKLAIEGANEATITLALQETPEYKDRFKANELRQKKGLSVLDPGTYLRNEDSYRQVLREYGLKDFDTDEYVSKFIANDMSPTEFSNRIVTAVQRVQNADPAVIKQLNDFYGITSDRLVAYVLDPEQQFQKIQRQVAAAEIGVAAGRQGLQVGVSVADQLAAQGITEAQAQKGYATIADILPTAEKLSDIYGTTMDTYGQSEAEQEVFNSLASAQRKRQQLTAREVAAFSGSAGAAKTSLSTSRVGQF
jgi:hypothetical protein